jgi:tRNA U34 5-methylaminomethyl-2-thiouridine-forming methyltransferase MnmC
MHEPRFKLVTLATGARSLRSLEHGETFHPVIGPMEEARTLHVAQHRFAERLEPGRDFVVWDVGLGAGANAIATIEAFVRLQTLQSPIHLLSFDQTLDPLEFALRHAEQLAYPLPWKRELSRLISDGQVKIGPVTWSLETGDFRERLAQGTGQNVPPQPRAVLFDPYSPAANPGMWDVEVFRAIRAAAGDDCTLSTYSRSTVIRVRLLLAGWCVGRGAATGEKTETTVAATRLDLLRDALGPEWLQRVSRSTAPALLEHGMNLAILVAELRRCPQMRRP